MPDNSKIAPSKGFFPHLNLDLIWQLIALGLLVGVILFYFDGLQPLILSKYTDNTRSQIDKLEKKFVQQTQSFTDLEIRVLNKIKFFNPSESCGLSQVVDLEDTDFQELQDFKTNLLPDASLETLPTYSVFYVTSYNNTYKNLYQDYEQALTDYHEVYKTSLSLVDFLEYRNSWVESCTKIQESKGNVAQLKTICTDQAQKQTEFFAKGIFSDLNSQLEKSTLKCQETLSFVEKPLNKGVYPNYSKWFLDWYTGFQNIMVYDTNFAVKINQLSTVNTQLSTKLNSARDEISDFENSKDPLAAKLYLLDIKS